MRLTPRANADYSQSLSYSLFLFGGSFEDSQFNLPCLFCSFVLVCFLGLVFAVIQNISLCFREDAPEFVASHI